MTSKTEIDQSKGWLWPRVRASVRQPMLLLAVSAIIMVPVAPAIAECGDFYRVEPGDTLRSIAVGNMSDADYRALFQANRDIVSDPGRIEVGQLLYLPCPGQAAQDRRSAATKIGLRYSRRDTVGDRIALREANELNEPLFVSEPTHTGAVPVRYSAPDGTVRLLSGSGLGPLADRDLPSGGMAPRIVQNALRVGGIAKKPRITVVDDWHTHLAELMPSGAYDLAFPWPAPDCDRPGASETVEKICRDFLFSSPIYELQFTFVAKSGDRIVEAWSHDALAGKTICHPEGFPPVELTRLEIDLRLTTAPTPQACATQILDGTADLISLPTPKARALMADAEYGAGLAEARFLVQSIPVHAVAWRGADGAEQLMERLETGLDALQTSGAWYQIVTRYLEDLDRRAALQ